MNLLLDTHTFLWFVNDDPRLSIELEHLKINATLTFHHRDPFDRIIIAQSMAENIPVITVDSVFNKYSIILI